MNGKYLTTGEFARLCGVTKETILHYDREGLLKSAHVSENGYRRYRAEQFFEFDMICFLKEAGSSLQDIKTYLSRYDAGSFLTMLDGKKAQLEAQRRRLSRRIKVLERISSITNAALKEEYGVLTVVGRSRQRLLATEVDHPGSLLTWDDSALHISRHIIRSEAFGLSTVFPLGTIIPQSCLADRSFAESHIFSTLDGPLKNADTLLKPAGRYATMLFKGRFDEVMPAFMAKFETSGLTIVGDAYVYALLSYLTSSDEENDVHRVEVAVG